MNKVRVRFAPSPTGSLHIGGVRTALYNYLFAKKHGGEFFLRIEDTDQGRFSPGSTEYIVESLKWLGISPDRGYGSGDDKSEYVQSERAKRGIYRDSVDLLIETGHAYVAFDRADSLERIRKHAEDSGTSWKYDSVTREGMDNSLNMREPEWRMRMSEFPYVVRFKTPSSGTVTVHDEVRGTVEFDVSQLDDKVLYKSDGMPTYHLASVVDDHLMEITHVIRGEEWLPSSPLHVLLYGALGWEVPRFAHLPLILKPDGRGKLNKRDGAKLGIPVIPLQWTDPSGEVSRGYREEGYFPEALLNTLFMLGWSPSDNNEIYTLDQMVDAFSLDGVNKSGARFDPAKARWFNQQHLRLKSPQLLADDLLPMLRDIWPSADESLAQKAVNLLSDRAVFIKDMTEVRYLVERPRSYDMDTVRDVSDKIVNTNVPDVFYVLKGLATALDTVHPFTMHNIEVAIHAYSKSTGIHMKTLMPLVRVMLSGVMSGPVTSKVIELIGRDEAIDRLSGLVAQEALGVG